MIRVTPFQAALLLKRLFPPRTATQVVHPSPYFVLIKPIICQYMLHYGNYILSGHSILPSKRPDTWRREDGPVAIDWSVRSVDVPPVWPSSAFFFRDWPRRTGTIHESLFTAVRLR